MDILPKTDESEPRTWLQLQRQHQHLQMIMAQQQQQNNLQSQRNLQQQQNLQLQTNLEPQRSLQQQQSDFQEQWENTFQAPTTPGWGIMDRVVKQEVDDKNNDSGVSPDHYTSNSTSPGSGRSLSIVNSLVSGTVSPDSQMQFDYREEFDKHVSDHNPRNIESPSLEAHSSIHNVVETIIASIQATSPGAQPLKGVDLEALSTPHLNSQGHVKTWTCRRCGFEATTKVDHWNHTRGHIAKDKILMCPYCPFVTELKHHIVYHICNHYEVKSFKCDHCKYECVNQSMLNSHLKSHSDIHQYSCSECDYVTKYCHSLKKHLRQKNHVPGPVLYPDGTINPNPIIDVYGKKRGPKTQPKKKQTKAKAQVDNNVTPGFRNALLNSQVVAEPSRLAPMQPGYFVSESVASQMHYSQQSQLRQIQQPQMQQMVSIVPMTPMLNVAISGSQAAMDEFHKLTAINAMAIMSGAHQVNGVAQVNGEALNPAMFNGNHFLANLSCYTENAAEMYARVQAYIEYLRSQCEDVTVPSVATGSETAEVSEDLPEDLSPLDLSKPSRTRSSEEPQATPSSAKATGTRRRKGKAFKIERREPEKESRDENISEERLPSPAPTTSATPPANCDERKDSTSTSSPASDESSTLRRKNYCQYCDVSFGDDIMHSVHMGYHGYQDPFTCNMCGQQCWDKVTFFVHIAKSKH